MSASAAYHVAKFLEAEGLGTFSTDIFVGNEPTEPANCLTVYDTGGAEDNPDGEYRSPSIQIRVRATDYLAGHDLAEQAARALRLPTGFTLGESPNQYHYTGFWITSDVAKIGRDDNNRDLFTVNFRSMREPVPVAPAIPCVYTLDAPLNEVQAAGYDGVPTVDNETLTAEFAIVSQRASLFDWIAAPAGAFFGGAMTLANMDAGPKRAVELQPLSLPAMVSGSVTVELAIAKPDLSGIYSLRVGSNAPNKFYIGTVNTGAPGTFVSSIIIDQLDQPPTDVAIVYDPAIEQIYVRYNGNNFQAVAATFTESLLILSGSEFPGVDAANAGQLVRWKAGLASADFIGSNYETNTTDFCGNNI